MFPHLVGLVVAHSFIYMCEIHTYAMTNHVPLFTSTIWNVSHRH